jgi:hypothetical protein
MIALMMFIALIIYIFLSFIFVRYIVQAATTPKSKKIAWSISLFIVLWFPVLEPLGSFLIYQAYGNFIVRATVYNTAQDVDRIFIDGNNIDSKIMMKRDQNERGATRKFAGYTYFEAYSQRTHYYVEENTKILVPDATIEKPRAKYFVKENISQLQPFCEKRTLTITDNTGTVFGEYVEILWFGSHLSQWLASMTHGRGHAGTHSPDKSFREFIQSVLVPAEKSE